MLFGDRQDFAVEVNSMGSAPYFLGTFTIWIGGIAVSDSEEEVMLPCVLASMEHYLSISDHDIWVDELEGATLEEAFRVISSVLDNSIFMFQITEAMDGVIMRVTIREGIATFMWTESDRYAEGRSMHGELHVHTVEQKLFRERLSMAAGYLRETMQEA